MTITLDNDDFIRGVLAAQNDNLRIERVALGSIDHIGGYLGYEWFLITHDDLNLRVLVLTNSEGGVEWKMELTTKTKRHITENLVYPFRTGQLGGLASLANILNGEGAALNRRQVSKAVLVELVRQASKNNVEKFNVTKWAKTLRFI